MDNKDKAVKYLEKLLDKSAEARIWHLKADLKARLKLLVSEDSGVKDLIDLWKRKNIIRKEFDFAQIIMDEAVEELAEELKGNEGLTKEAEERLDSLLRKLNDASLQIL